MSDLVIVTTSYGGTYVASAEAVEAEFRARQEGALAKKRGIEFHDNPYRKGPATPMDWLYGAWEYGYTHSAERWKTEPFTPATRPTRTPPNTPKTGS